MEEFARQFGVDGKLLASQVVNFFILFFVLRRFAYQPLVHMLEERKIRIQDGITKAEEADKRLVDAEVAYKDKLHEAEAKSLDVMRAADVRAKETEGRLLGEAREKRDVLLRDASREALALKESEREAFLREAEDIIEKAIVKVVELQPEAIDKALIRKALTRIEERA